MATYESATEQTRRNIAPVTLSSDEDFIPVVIQEANTNSPLLVKTRAELIDGVIPVSKGGTGIDKLTGKKLIASNVDGNFMEEVDILVEHLAGLKENVQEKLDSIRKYTLEVTTGDWVSSSGTYYKEFNLSGIKSTDNPIIGLVLSSSNKTGVEKEKYAYSCIDKVDVNNDKVIIRCFDETPTTNIVLDFVCV